MEKEQNSQLELFSHVESYDNLKTTANRKSFLLHVRAYEKILLMIISFITIAIISFTLGVERGKKTVLANAGLEPVVRKVVEEKQEPAVEKFRVLFNETENIVTKEKEKTKALQAGYTIQIASYKTKTNAKKEAELLKKKGFSPLCLTKGNYTVVCIGSFSSKDAAESLLSELKKQKRYVGSLIRRL